MLRLIVITSLCATRTQTKDRYIAVNVRRPSLLFCISSTQFNIAFKPHSFAPSQASLHRPILPQQPQTDECHFSEPPLEHRQPPTCHREFLSTPLFLPTLPWKIAPTTTARLEGLRVSQDHRKKPRFTAGAETWTPRSETRVSDGDGDDRDDDDHHNYDDDARLGADTDSSTPSLTSQDQQLIAPPVSRAQARAQHQTSTFDSQLSRLRESDRRSIQHLPTSQQRVLLATQFKQMEMGGKAASARRGALESAGNSFGRLSSVRLVRIPPHSGRVQSLKH